MVSPPTINYNTTLCTERLALQSIDDTKEGDTWAEMAKAHNHFIPQCDNEMGIFLLSTYNIMHCAIRVC